MNFEDFKLKKTLLSALQELEFEEATPIQIKTYPLILAGKDVVGIAQTGTGKTIAYLLPILQQLLYSDRRQPRVVIVVPTRELVIQVVNEVKKITPYLSIRTVGIYGGTNIKTQKQNVYDGSDILVATAGRLYDLIMSGVLRMKEVQKFIIDEVDEMFNLGFRPQLTAIMETLPPKRQNLMFSATLLPEIEEVIKHFFYQPEIITIAPHGTPLDQIIQIGYPVANFNTKLNMLEYLLKNSEDMNKVLVFISTKKLADQIFNHFDKLFPNDISIIHSNKSQNQRFNAVKSFQDGTFRVLIATDVVARGIDIQNITHVINFDTPAEPGDYIHRIGRTGRADKPGTAITFISEREGIYLDQIEELMKKLIDLRDFPKEVPISNIVTLDERVTPLFDIPYLNEKPVKAKKAAPSKAKVNAGKKNLRPKEKKFIAKGWKK